METHVDSLPSDSQQLKTLLLQHQQALFQKDNALARSAHEIELPKSQLAWLEEQLRLPPHKRFGASSEQHPHHNDVLNEAEGLADEAGPEVMDEQEITYRRSTRKPGRRPRLPREEVTHDLSDADKVCDDCGGALHRIGEESSEKLVVIPATAKVIVHVRPKYACRGCEDGTKTVPFPPQSIPQSIATAGLLPWVVTGKFLDRKPLYHLKGVF